MRNDQLELNRFEKIAMQMYLRFGGVGLIAISTAFSVVISVAFTIPLIAMVADDTMTSAELADPLTYIHIAILVPLLVAPLCCSVFTRLLKRLNVAYQRVAELSTTDPLTGSANRRGFLDGAAQNIFTLHEAEACMVGMVDLDKFKFVNDTYGHQVGDEALMCVANSLSEVIGNFGLVGRLGGDEFAFIALGSVSDLNTLKQQLNTQCASLLLTNGTNVCSSIGIVTLEDSENVEQALVRADNMLYELKASKSSGRMPNNAVQH